MIAGLFCPDGGVRTVEERAVSDNEPIILIIGCSRARANRLKDNLNLLGSPTVVAATPSNWRLQLDNRHATAIFIGDEIPDPDQLKLDIENFDPNTTIRYLSSRQNHAKKLGYKLANEVN